MMTCSRCERALPPERFNRPGGFGCPGCGAALEVMAFPALVAPRPLGRAGQRLVDDAEASCFYHPSKRAVVPCDGCGRFLCALCDCELNQQHLCPTCLETGRRKGEIRSLETRRTLYDSVALSLAILPLLIFYFTLVTAPLALYVALRYWNAPSSLLPRTKVRFVVAIGLSSLQILGWLVGLFYLTANLLGGPPDGGG